MSNRDFSGNGLKYWSYRGRKDTSVALYYSWLLGEVMITNRRGFDRIYDLRERVLPKEYDFTASIRDSEDFFARKTIAFLGMMREKRFRAGWSDAIERTVTQKEERNKLGELYERRIVVSLRMEGSHERWITLAENVPLLDRLESGEIPPEWKPVGSSTMEEVTFLAPLDMVSARGRAKQVFDFEYVWEVYKPVHQRRWGYYTLPILYGDDLVARLDPKLDRSTGEFQILGFWLEKDAPKDEAFANALANGLRRFVKMSGAKKVNLTGMKPLKLRSYLKQKITL
jgi:uncharacterized protein YcaQ